MVIFRNAFLWENLHSFNFPCCLFQRTCENLYCFNFPCCLFQRTCFPSPSRIQTPDAFGQERWVFLMMRLSVKMIMIRIITMVMMVTLIVILQRWLQWHPRTSSVSWLGTQGWTNRPFSVSSTPWWSGFGCFHSRQFDRQDNHYTRSGSTIGWPEIWRGWTPTGGMRPCSKRFDTLTLL